MDGFIRAGGWAAIIGGGLRAASSFLAGGDEVERQSMYFVIDLLLLLGVFAAYAQNEGHLRRLGMAGFLITVTGILLVRSSRAVPGVDLYPAGALSVAVGWVLLTLDWSRTSGPVFVPALFLLSVVTGLIGQIAPHAVTLFIASGVIFGAAMIGVGRQILLAATKRP